MLDWHQQLIMLKQVLFLFNKLWSHNQRQINKFNLLLHKYKKDKK